MMSRMQAWFTGGPSNEGEGGPGSLLEDWNSYAAKSSSSGPSRDLESVVPESFAPLLKTASDTFSGAFTSVSNTVRELPGNVQSATSSLPSRTALTYFGLMMSVGVFFCFLAFTLFLPTMMARKFAITFTLGCLFIMGSMFALKGPKSQFFHMISRERLPFTIAFLASMAGTIFVSMFLHSYILSLVFAIVQVMAMLYYMVSYFPGGTTGLTFVGTLLTGSVKRCFGS
ncbi:unnamed protein product [Calypogeia fissa]